MALMTTTQMLTSIKNWVLGKISSITALIPLQASSSNQLADKAFVNSSIAMSTATFLGTYNVVTDLSLAYNATHSQIASALATKLSALFIEPNNNDYVFVQIPTSGDTSTEIAKVEKYKYNGLEWDYEYDLNNSGFTAEQWAAINSGATLELIGKLSALPTNSELTTLLNAKAEKAANATSGHLAGLDSNGNPTDSGIGLEDNGAYDVSAHNGGATFASMSALLSDANLSTLIPTAVRKGGMSIKFVLTSDNKYVQCRYMGTAITGSPNPFLDTANWQGVDAEPIAESKNLVESGGVADALTIIKGEKKNYESGYYYQNNVGSDSDYIRTTDYIPVQPNDVVKWVFSAGEQNNSKMMPIYDSNRGYLSAYAAGNVPTGQGWREVTITNESVAYLRATFWANYKSSARIYINGVEVYRPLDEVKSSFVQTREQTFTSDEKSQARNNIGAASQSDMSSIEGALTNSINTVTNSINTVNSNLSDSILGQSVRTYFTGADNTAKDIKVYGLIPGHKYRFTPKEQFWDMSGVSIQDGIAFFLFIYNYKSDGTNTVLKTATTRAGRNPYYDVTIPSDSDYIKLGGRATTNVKVWFEILDVTSTEDIISPYIPTETVVSRNADKVPMLINSCRWHKTSNSFKDFQVAICTDMHGARVANQNVIAATNGFPYIDAYINCGDIVGANYEEPTVIENFATDFATLGKPGFLVVGNHDVGNAYYVGVCCNHKQAYESFIKPMVDNGFLTSGEYETNKPYWYHDIFTYKIRLIGLYEYDDNLDLEASNSYWEAVTYDSTKPSLEYNTSYNVDDIVNAGDYDTYSFKCIQAVTTPSNWYTNREKLPCYRVQRGRRVIRATQAQWFLDTLASTPSDYGVIVITHNPFSDKAESINAKFSWPSGESGGSSTWTQSDMSTNFIRDAIVAFANGTSYSEKVVMKGTAAYLNTLNDGTINYAYEVSKNFSANNSGVYVLGLLGGHAHRDFIWKDATENIYQISPNCAKVDGANDAGGDIRRTNTDGLAHDSITCASFASGRIGLVKLGVNVTERGTFRDYEVIDTSV